MLEKVEVEIGKKIAVNDFKSKMVESYQGSDLPQERLDELTEAFTITYCKGFEAAVSFFEIVGKYKYVGDNDV